MLDALAETGVRETPLHDLHVEFGARMVSCAGYQMPLHYQGGIVSEHLHTRANAALFDISHLGLAFVCGSDHATTASALEALTPSCFAGLLLGQQRYTVLLNEEGGIVDDLLVTRSASPEDDGRLMLTVNAVRKQADFAWLTDKLPSPVRLTPVEDRALLALQGPDAYRVLVRHAPEVAGLEFLSASSMEFDGIDCHISRSGYSGEDGFELSVPAGAAEPIAKALLADDRVAPAGLGARDTLRLEAGLCLYGLDLDETVSPVEAGLLACLPKRRREQGGFPGEQRILREYHHKPVRQRIGLRLNGQVPMRAGAEIALPDEGPVIGRLTSGGFSPCLGGPIGMGYIPPVHGRIGARLEVVARGRRLAATVTELPFVPDRTCKRKKQ